MPDILYDHHGIPHKASDIKRADALLRLKRENSTNIWPVIAAIIDTWKSTHPQTWKSYLIEVGKIKATRSDPEFGLSHDKSQHIRYTVDLPEPVYFMIRAVYSEEELPLGGQQGREFYQEFAKRFPTFAVAQKQ